MSAKELPPEKAKLVMAALHLLLAEEERKRVHGARVRLARRLKVSPPTVSNWFTGKTSPSFDTAVRVAAAQGIGTWLLLGERPPDAAMPGLTTHPNLLTALDIAGARAGEGARAATLSAAAYLPDLATPTWLAVLFDPAHAKST